MTPRQYFYSRMAVLGLEEAGDELAAIVRVLTAKQLLSINPTFDQMRSFTFIRDLHYGHSMRLHGEQHAVVVIEVLKLHIPKAGKK